MIELWIRDEYGQASIIDRSDDHSGLFKKALDRLEDENFDNALTAEETERNWSCYLPVSMDDGDNDKINAEYLYSGTSSPGRQDFFSTSDESSSRIPIESVSIKILIGQVDGKNVYVKTPKKKFIDSIDNDTLRLKSFLFFKEK